MSDNPTFKEIHSPLSRDQDTPTLGALVAHYWQLLRRYYWIILITVVVGVAGAYLWTRQQPEIYQASSEIIFHQKQGSVFGRNIEQVELMGSGGRWNFEQFWNSQKEVLRSRWFAERIVKREGLVHRKGFLAPPPPGTSRGDDDTMKQAVQRVLAVSNVQLKRDSRVASVMVQTRSPQLSADIANAVTEEYIKYTREFQSGGLKEIVNWFDNYVSSKKQELERAQNDLQTYKRKHNILSLSYENRQNLTATNMQAVSDDLAKVRAELARQQAKLEQVRQVTRQGGDLTAVAGLIESRASGESGQHSSIKEAVDRRASLQEEYARLTTRYMENHPDVQEVKKQLEAVNANIGDAIDRGRSQMKNQVAALQRTKSKLEGQLAAYKDEMFELNDLGVEYKQLKNRADNLEQLYDTVLQRSSELNINSRYESNDIQVLEHAQLPASPISPVLPLNLALGCLLGLGLGVGVMVVVDSLDTTIKSEEDIAQISDKPILTTLPRLEPSVLKGVEVIGQSAADTITHTAPKSSYAEGIKTLRTNLTFMSPDDPPELMLVTSPGPSEGKTITSVNTAIAMAQSGHKTVLIDADLRRPRLHKALDVDNDAGLTSFLRKQAALDAVARPTGIDGLDVVTCGGVPPNPSELLQSERFHELITGARGDYDRVIFDSPPLGAVADALILSNVVDGVLLVLKFAKTRKEMLARSVDQLQGIGAPLMGLVLNEISRRGGGYYGHKYYGRYSYGEDTDPTRLAS